MKVAAYLRVSTRRQKDDGQRLEIQQWLKGNGIDPSQVEWYRDKESGTTLERPEFDRLQRDIFAGRVKTVVLWKLDLLSRRLRDGVNILADWCERRLRVEQPEIKQHEKIRIMINPIALGVIHHSSSLSIDCSYWPL